ncbi:MAG: Icc-related predicted phosphoesterase [Planctomycetota bacterium]|jgi:Icc-related predicted phosphoesterase
MTLTMTNLRIVCLSDTHNLHDSIDVPDGDVLIHAGDFTGRGYEHEVESFGKFLAKLPHREKVIIAGNHDFLFQDEPELARKLLGDVTYLYDSGAEIADLRFWGAPWQPWYKNWAFNLQRGDEIGAKWKQIPDDTDILITHGPAFGVLDRTFDGSVVGCEELVVALERVRPRMHVFGHIHEGYGTTDRNDVLRVNASNCNIRYKAANPAIVIDWDGEQLRVVE